MTLSKNKGAALFWVLMSTVLFCTSVVGQTNLLTGTINMPTGVVPVSSAAVFRISTVPLDTIEENQQTFTDVSIAPLSTSANYSITLLDAEPDVEPQTIPRKLRFDCISGCANIRITTTGFWGGSAGVVGEAEAIEFDGFAPQVINITLERADHFSGTFELPDSFLASGAEVFTITATGSQFTDPPTFSQQISTVEGENKWGFYLGMPATSTGGGWTLSLSCDSCDELIPQGPYFPTTLSGNPLSTESQGQFSFLKNRSYSNIQMTIPGPEPVVVDDPKVISIAPITLLLFDE